MTNAFSRNGLILALINAIPYDPSDTGKVDSKKHLDAFNHHGVFKRVYYEAIKQRYALNDISTKLVYYADAKNSPDAPQIQEKRWDVLVKFGNCAYNLNC